MSASEVLNVPSYYSTLAPNDALADLTFCNECKPPKAQSLKHASKNFHTTRGFHKNPFCPKYT